MNIFKCSMVLALILFSLTVDAVEVKFTPPGVLTIDSQNIISGVFTIESFSGFDMNLVENKILDLGNSADDISHAVTLGSGGAIDLVQFSGELPSIVSFDYNFDSTAPDLSAIGANVLSASTSFGKFLPLSSTGTGFFEVIDSSGEVSFHTTKASLSFSASGNSTDIDLFGDASIFAIFGAGDSVLSAALFQDHGDVLITPSMPMPPPGPGIPIPAAAWLFASGLIGLIGMRKARLHI